MKLCDPLLTANLLPARSCHWFILSKQSERWYVRQNNWTE